MASGEYMNGISSHACCGNLVFGLRTQPPPPDIDTYVLAADAARPASGRDPA